MTKSIFGECIWCRHDRVLPILHSRNELCTNCQQAAYLKAKELGIDIDTFVGRIRRGEEGMRRTLTSKSLITNLTKEVKEQNEKLIGVLREIANGDEHHYGYDRAKYLALQALKEVGYGQKGKDEDAPLVPEKGGVHETRSGG